jgi:ribose-phosphate pyrophosphokinase
MSRAPISLISCATFREQFGDQADLIAKELFSHGLQVEHCSVTEDRFPDGELCIELHEDPRDKTVVLCQAITSDTSSDKALITLLAISCCLKDFGARRIIAIVPYLAYSRHDRIMASQRRPIMARLVADMMASAGIDNVVTVGSGSESRISVIFESAGITLLQGSRERIVRSQLHSIISASSVLVAPDGGAAKSVISFGQTFGLESILMEKARLGAEHVSIRMSGGQIPTSAQHMVVVDDLITSAATAAAATEAILGRWPNACIDYVAPHLRLTSAGSERAASLFRKKSLRRIFTSDAAGIRSTSPTIKVSQCIPFLAQDIAVLCEAE